MLGKIVQSIFVITILMVVLGCTAADKDAVHPWSMRFDSKLPFYLLPCNDLAIVPRLSSKDSFVLTAIDRSSGLQQWTWSASAKEVGPFYYAMTMACSSTDLLMPLGRTLVVLDVKDGSEVAKLDMPAAISQASKLENGIVATTVWDDQAVYTYMVDGGRVHSDTCLVDKLWKTFPPFLVDGDMLVPIVQRDTSRVTTSALLSVSACSTDTLRIDNRLGRCFSKPAFVGDDAAYLLAVDSLYRVNRVDGSLSWSAQMPSTMLSSQLFSRGSLLAYQGDDLHLYGIDPSQGAITDTLRTGAMIGRWSMAGDRHCAVTPDLQRLYCVQSDFQTMTSYELVDQRNAELRRIFYIDESLFAFYNGDSLHVVSRNQFDQYFSESIEE